VWMIKIMRLGRKNLLKRNLLDTQRASR